MKSVTSILVGVLSLALLCAPGHAVAPAAKSVPASGVVVIKVSGDHVPYLGVGSATTNAQRGAAAVAALAAATSGDYVCLGPGTFAAGTAVFDVPDGVSLIGAGTGLTTLTTTSTSKTCVCPGVGSLIKDLTISVPSSGYPLGAVLGGSQKASTGVEYRNVKTLGGIDGIIYNLTAATGSFTAYDCEFVSGWDTCYVVNCTGTLYNCIFRADPSLGAGSFGYGVQCNGPQTNHASADLTIIGGRVQVSGGSTNNRGALCTLGVVRMNGVLINSSGTGAIDLVRAGGTLYADDISTPTGIAASTSGTITWADVVAGTKPGSSGLTALAATSAANLQTAAGTVIGTNVQAYDADLTTYAGITPSANVQSLLGAANNAAITTQLGLTIGTNTQAYDADLTTYAGITPSANVQSILSAANYAAINTLLGQVIGTNTQGYRNELLILNETTVTIASATTPNIAGAASDVIEISGTTGISGFTTSTAGITRKLRFQSAVILTHSSSLRLPGAANITTAANDTAVFQCTGTTNWQCIAYQRSNGDPVKVVNVNQGGTGATTIPANRVIYTSALDTIATNANLTFSGTTLTVSNTLTVTGAGTFTSPGSSLLEFRDGGATPMFECGTSASWNGLIMGSGFAMGWSSNTNPASAGVDYFHSRIAAGNGRANGGTVASPTLGVFHHRDRYTATATSYTTVINDKIIGVTSTAAARTITLLAAATYGSGAELIIKDESLAAGTNNITIDANASETIDNNLTIVISTNGGSARLYTNGTNWFTY